MPVIRQEDSSNTPPAPWLRRLTRWAPPAAKVALPAKVGLKASVSEFLLVTRLRARNLLDRRRQAAPDAAQADAEQAAVMTRFAHILGVTCKHWFPEDTLTDQRHRPKL